MVVEQTRTLAGLVKEREAKATEIADEAKAKTQDAIEHTVAAQKTALDFAAKQAKAGLETIKQQFGYAGTPAGAAADSMQRGMEVVVEAQKDFLDVIKGPIQILH
jgi:vacuolar-type H+-ATPase subunit E/Vma4